MDKKVIIFSISWILINGCKKDQATSSDFIPLEDRIKVLDRSTPQVVQNNKKVSRSGSDKLRREIEKFIALQKTPISFDALLAQAEKIKAQIGFPYKCFVEARDKGQIESVGIKDLRGNEVFFPFIGEDTCQSQKIVSICPVTTILTDSLNIAVGTKIHSFHKDQLELFQAELFYFGGKKFIALNDDLQLPMSVNTNKHYVTQKFALSAQLRKKVSGFPLTASNEEFFLVAQLTENGAMFSKQPEDYSPSPVQVSRQADMIEYIVNENEKLIIRAITCKTM